MDNPSVATLHHERQPSSRVRVAGTNLAWQDVTEWAALVMRIGSIVRPATAHYARCDALYRSLTHAHIRDCRDQAALRGVEKLFDLARHVEIPEGRGLRRTFTRSELGETLVEVRNRIAALEAGRDRPRPAGPRFDVQRIPDAALDRLIQQHRDLAVVDACRAERARRQAAGDGQGRGGGRAGSADRPHGDPT